jgi:hypothetical protein
MQISGVCGSEFVDDYRRSDGLGNLAKMTVVGEVYDLSLGCHPCKQLEGLLSAKIVERLHDVVAEKRRGEMRPGELVIASHSKSEIQLRQ